MSTQPVAYVPFTYKAKGASSVFLSGSFNNFAEASILENVGDDTFLQIVALLPGDHTFRFNVDGNFATVPEIATKDIDGVTYNTLTVDEHGKQTVFTSCPLPISAVTTTDDAGLGDASSDNIDKLSSSVSMTAMPVEMHCSKPESVTQKNNSFACKSSFSFKDENTLNSENTKIEFFITLPYVQYVDAIDVDVTLARMWFGDSDSLAYNYVVDVDFDSEDGWKNVISKFNLNSVILADVGDSNKGKHGSIAVGVRAQKLRVTINADVASQPKSQKKGWSKYCRHQSDFDTNGVLYYIGTKGGKEAYTNPAADETVKVTTSHNTDSYSASKPLENLISHENKNLSTPFGGSAPVWFSIDLGQQYRLLCSGYTLRHGYSYNDSFICNWELQGSNDDENYTPVHEQYEAPFSEAWGTKTFTCDKSRNFYRYFRIYQKSNYSMGFGQGPESGSPYLYISGLELYGELTTNSVANGASPNSIDGVSFVCKSLTPRVDQPKTQPFEYVSDFDTNGLLYHIGTNDGEASVWSNPVTSGKLSLKLSHPLNSSHMLESNVLSRTGNENTYWGGSSPQNFVLDLGENVQFRTNYYTLRHGYDCSNSYVCDWELQVSENNTDWVTIHSQGNPVFTKGFDIKSFPVTDCNGYYRYFRLVQKGNYSMGYVIGDGSPYLCINGFEVYGEKLLSAGGSAKGSVDFTAIAKTRSLYRSMITNQEFHKKLMAASFSEDLTVRHKAMKLLTSVWTASPVPLLHAVEGVDIAKFIKLNIVNSVNATLKLGSGLVSLFLVAGMTKSVFDALLANFADATNTFVSENNMNVFFDILGRVWDHDAVAAFNACKDNLFALSKNLDSRSPLYNIIRAHLDLYGFAFERDVFAKGIKKKKPVQQPSNNYWGSPPPPEAPKDDLPTTAEGCETKLIQTIQAHEADRVTLNGLLEQANISGNPQNQSKEITKAYNDAVDKQNLIKRLRQRLRKLSPSHVSLTGVGEDCKLDRWTLVSERIMRVLNSAPDNEATIPNEELLNFVFSRFCVHGTPGLRREASTFLGSNLGSRPGFLIDTLERYFSEEGPATKSGELFNEKALFATLQDFIQPDSDKIPHILNELFAMIGRLSAAPKMDVKLLKWVLVLLNSILKNYAPPPPKPAKTTNAFGDDYYSGDDVGMGLFGDEPTPVPADDAPVAVPSTDDAPVVEAKCTPTHLTNLFVILNRAIEVQPPLGDLAHLASTVLVLVAGQQEAKNLIPAFFEQAQFDEFFRKTNVSPGFIRTGFLVTTEKLLSDETYVIKKGLATQLKEIRSLLRNKVIALLETQTLDPIALLEHLLAVTSDADVSKSDASYPLDNVAPSLITYLIDNCKLNTITSTRAWCLVIKLLVYSDPQKLAKLSTFNTLIRLALQASADYQIFFTNSLVSLLTLIFNQKESESWRATLVPSLIEFFPKVLAEKNCTLYAQLVNAVLKGSTSPLTIDNVVSLVNAASEALPDPAEAGQGKTEEAQILVEILELVVNAISAPEFKSEQRKELWEKTKQTNIAQSIVKWLSKHGTPVQSGAKKVTPENVTGATLVKDVNRHLQTFVKTVSAEDSAASVLLETCYNSFTSDEKTSQVIVDFAISLMRSDELALRFMEGLNGYELLSQQIQASASSTASQSQIASAMGSGVKMSGLIDGMENFVTKTAILSPAKDTTFSSMFKNSTPGNSSYVWLSTYTYSYSYDLDSQKEKDKPDVVVSFDLGQYSLLREFRVTSTCNYGEVHKYPIFAVIETATSPGNYLPAGKLKISGTEKSTASQEEFRYKLPKPEIARYIKLTFRKASGCPGVGICNLQFLGHSNLLTPITEGGSSSKLAVTSCIALLEHCLKFDSIKTKLAKSSEVGNFALYLLSSQTPDTKPRVQSILLQLASKEASLVDTLLTKSASPESGIDGSFAGKLFGIIDSQTSARYQKFKDLVFNELKTFDAKSLSPSLTANIGALSEALSNYKYKKVDVKHGITSEEFNTLFNVAVASSDASLIQQNAIRLMAIVLQYEESYFEALLANYKSVDKVTEILASKDSKLNNPLKLLGMLSSTTPKTAQALLSSGVLTHIITLVSDYKNKTGSGSAIEVGVASLLSASYHSLIKNWIGDNAYPLLFELLSKREFGADVLLAIQDVFRRSSNLSKENQEKVANFLLQQFKSGPEGINEFTLQLVIDLFNIQNQAAVCLHSKNGTVEEQEASRLFAGSAKVNLTVSEEHCNSKLTVGSDGSISSGGSMDYEWRTVQCEQGLSSGVHTWEVVIDKVQSGNIMIGVCERKHELNYWLGQSTSLGWSFYGASPGYAYHNGNSKCYGKQMKNGDVIGITLDMDAGTIAFTQNGTDYGVCYSDLGDRGELYPAVSLYDVGDCVRFQSFKSGSISLAGVSSLPPSNPLLYQRSEDVFYKNTTTTFQALSDIIVSQTPDKTVLFTALDGSSISPNTLVDDILTKVTTGSELIDVVLEIVPKLPSDEAPPAELPKEDIAAKHSSILKRFAHQEGLFVLLDVVESFLEKKEARQIIENEGKTKEDKPAKGTLPLKTWRAWATLLRDALKVTGFADEFIQSEDCRILLFTVIREAANMPADTKTKVTNKEVMEAPVNALLQLLFEVLAPKKSSGNFVAVKEQLVTSGFLTTTLINMSKQVDILPRDGDNAEFAAYVAATNKARAEEAERRAKKDANRTYYWAKGTGFGTHQDEVQEEAWSHADYNKTVMNNSQALRLMLDVVSLTLAPVEGDKPETVERVLGLVRASAIIPILESYLRNDSLLDMGKYQALYETLLKVVGEIASVESLVDLLEHLPGSSSSVFELLSALNNMAKIVVTRLPGSIAVEPTPEGEADPADELKIAKDIVKTFSEVEPLVKAYRTKHNKEEVSKTIDGDSNPSHQYVQIMSEHMFGECSMLKPKTSEYNHHYKDKISSDSFTGQTAAKKMKRLIQEVSTLSNGLPIHPESSMFLRIDETRMDVMKCLITGPKDTPYDNGAFEFHIYCPAEYPRVPPNVNLETTGHGAVRFNPNLYNCGKVCLSILGTWRGGPNEEWNEHISTLSQVFISIQSLILVPEPYFNEPGYESSMGTESGTQASVSYNEVIKIGCLKWAILEQLKNPSPGFETVIKKHFLLKKEAIRTQIADWLIFAKESKTSGHYDQMVKLTDDIEKELKALEENSEEILALTE